MTTFLTTLRTLDAAATPGPWTVAHPYREMHLRDIITGSTEDCTAWTVMTVNSRRSEFEENAALAAYLRNHAAAIIGCVEALETIKSNAESQLTAMDAIHIPVDAPAYKSAVWHRSISLSALAALEEK